MLRGWPPGEGGVGDFPGEEEACLPPLLSVMVAVVVWWVWPLNSCCTTVLADVSFAPGVRGGVSEDWFGGGGED